MQLASRACARVSHVATAGRRTAVKPAMMPAMQVRMQSQGGYYPPVPGFQPEEPSAPPLPADGSVSYYPSDGSAYAPSSTGLTEEQLLEAEDIEDLRKSAGAVRNLSFVGFWLQFALSIVSAGILFFSAAFVPQGSGGVASVSKYVTLVGVIAAFISSLMAHGFKQLARKLQDGGDVTRRYLVTTLLTNNAICLAGIAVTVIGLQASVGTLVAKTLMTAVSGPYNVNTSTNALVSLDVFALQASTNTLLCHVIGLVFTNLVLRLVNRQVGPARAA